MSGHRSGTLAFRGPWRSVFWLILLRRYVAKHPEVLINFQPRSLRIGFTHFFELVLQSDGCLILFHSTSTFHCSDFILGILGVCTQRCFTNRGNTANLACTGSAAFWMIYQCHENVQFLFPNLMPKL